MAIDALGQEQYKSLTKKEFGAVMEYCAMGFETVNGDLRFTQQERGGLPQGTQEIVDDIDSAFSKVSPPQVPLTLYRSFDFGEIGDDLKVGDIFRDDAYVSTSFKIQTALSFADRSILAEIHTSPGQRMLVGSEHEYEVILPRETRFKVVSDSGEQGTDFREMVPEPMPTLLRRHMVLEVVK